VSFDAEVVAIVPARAGSKGLPGKNRRTLVDRPLFMHSVACAQRLIGTTRVLISSDDEELVGIARDYGLPVDGLRPQELALDDTPMADVIRYETCNLDFEPEYVLLLDPTSPLRQLGPIEAAIETLRTSIRLDGVISVSRPSFNPLWVGVTLEEDCIMRPLRFSDETYIRRQDVPDYWRINGSFYLWRTSFARSLPSDWVSQGLFSGCEIPDLWSHSIDTEDDFKLVESLVSTGVISLEWMEGNSVG
jgi:CMP-N,N'-diacetyllegionaminic acid synthase